MAENFPIVLAHGLFGSLSDNGILQAFNRETHAPDLLGYGEFSSHNIAGITLEDQ